MAEAAPEQLMRNTQSDSAPSLGPKCPGNPLVQLLKKTKIFKIQKPFPPIDCSLQHSSFNFPLAGATSVRTSLTDNLLSLDCLLSNDTLFTSIPRGEEILNKNDFLYATFSIKYLKIMFIWHSSNPADPRADQSGTALPNRPDRKRTDRFPLRCQCLPKVLFRQIAEDKSPEVKWRNRVGRIWHSELEAVLRQ